ncbi:ATP-binding protein (plasmid) [Ideonella dechloratans]|nr:ATP-binding protein [Ideonella dechloratans]
MLAGEVDALVDGIRPVTPQALASLRAEVERLGELVNDLNELALSDAGALSYRMAPVALADFLERRVAEHRWHFEQHGLDLRLLPLPAGAQGWQVQGDEGRLQQLLDNLLANSYRYTDAPGRVEMSLEARAEALWVEIHDSPPGVPQEELSRLFERLYRVEGSRSRGTGGAGLGLSICRNIAQAHGGHIEALASPLGGVCVRLSLPRLHHPTHPAPAA